MPHEVIMPALGMAQDTGLLLAWHKKPGDLIAAGDILFEVETDKSTMEVEAQTGGYLADVRASEGDNVPVGNVIAVISREKPDAPDTRSEKTGTPEPDVAPAFEKTAPTPKASPAAPLAADPATQVGPMPTFRTSGKILASPKTKRLAREQGLDLERLARAGLPQPFHVSDLDTLKTLPPDIASSTAQDRNRRIVAEVDKAALFEFVGWLSSEIGQTVRRETVLAGFAAAALRSVSGGDTAFVQTQVRGINRSYRDPDLVGFGSAEPMEVQAVPSLVLRDLSGSPVTSIELGAENIPVVTVSGAGEALTITCECAGDVLSAEAALTLATEFVERVANPLRQLL